MTAPSWIVPGAAAAGVLARLPLVTAPASADEAGFLVIGGQWSSGDSLYGDYWVDRPPLLIAIFRLAAENGGLITLRLLGCLAVVIVVLASARAARLLAGPNAAAVTAVAAAALFSSPLLQVHQVNGELLAAPFVALGVLAMVAANDRPRAWRLWVASGAAGASALLVKQNIADVLVFDALLLTTAAVSRRISADHAIRAAAGVGAGAAAATALVVTVALWHGTAPGPLFEAMYLFRLEARATIAEASNLDTTARALNLVWAWLGSALALALALILVRAATHRGPVLLGLAGVGLFDLVSVVIGGNYWLHYLIQMAVPIAIGVGLLAEGTSSALRSVPPGWGRRSALRLAASGAAGRWVVGLMAASSVLSMTVYAPRVLASPESASVIIGQEVAKVAGPGDTFTSLYGRPQINLASGLRSPYPYLWSLPTRVRDPRLEDFVSLLGSRRAPTWLLLRRDIVGAPSEVDVQAVRRVIDVHYRPVARVGAQILLRHRGIDRENPDLSRLL